MLRKMLRFWPGGGGGVIRLIVIFILIESSTQYELGHEYTYIYIGHSELQSGITMQVKAVVSTFTHIMYINPCNSDVCISHGYQRVFNLKTL